jgi:hypothetical protein
MIVEIKKVHSVKKEDSVESTRSFISHAAWMMRCGNYFSSGYLFKVVFNKNSP